MSRVFLVAWFGAIAAAPLTPAVAQTAAAASTSVAPEASAVGEVIVTAQRRSESIFKVPLAVSAISGTTLTKIGVTQPTGLASIIPNLQVNDATGGTEPNFTLRGIGLGNEYDDNQASPVGIYTDDAYLAFRATHGAQLYDLDHVEVLRGPQGTLYGRNTTGGAINFITRKPTLSGQDGFIEAGYGNFNDYRVQAAVEETPIEGVLGVRAALSYESHDGYIKNLFPGQPDLASEDTLSGRIAARYRPTDALDINLKIYAEEGKQTQPGVYQLGPSPTGANAISGYSRGNLPFFDVDSDQVHYNSTHATGSELTVKYKLNDELSIQSLSSFDVGSSLLGQDVDGSPVNLLTTVFHSDYIEANQELRLVYSGDRLKVQGGVYYGWDRITVNNRYDLLGFLQGLGVPADPTFTAGGGTILQHYDQTRQSGAIFGQADYNLTPHLTATLGLRYTDDRATYTNGTAFIGDYDFNPLVETVGTPGHPLDKAGDDSAVTGRAALSYRFDNGTLLYASYNRGYRSGTFNGSGYLSPTQVSFVAPETVNAYEAGAKGRLFDGRVTYAAAAFYYDYQNQQLLDVVGPVGFLRNAGSSTVEGVELEGSARLTSTLSFTGSVGGLSSKYNDLTLQGVNLDGNRLPFAPSITSNGRFDWRLGEVGGGAMTFSPSVTYTSKVYFSPFNNQDGNQPLHQNGYVLTDLSLEWARSDWTVRLWAKNLFNTDYFVYGNSFVQTAGFYYFNQGAPRTFGIAVRKAF